MRNRLTRLALIVGAFVAATLLIACGDDDDSTATATEMSAEPETVNVTVDEFSIESSLTTFQAGVPYHFVVTNEGQAPHEVMIIEPMETGGMSMTEMDEMAVAVVEEDDLEAGDTYEFDVTFDHPYAEGELEFACHLAGHYEAGMHTPITVE
jgi:uncharacterized cupredoxin-like copper-binding protein